MEFFYLPDKYHAKHVACFEMIRQVEGFIVDKDYKFLCQNTFPLTESEKDKLAEVGDIWDFLKQYKEEVFYRLLNKQILLGLLKDFCYFMQESLDCSNKKRLVVAYALLRRPVVDNLKILLRLIGDDAFYDNFINRDDYDPAHMSEDDLKSLLKETDKIRFCEPITSDLIYGLVYDRTNPRSIINLSNRAIHPVTTRPWNKTGEMNFNFMFTTESDIEGLWRIYYTALPPILIFYSELFNAAIFSLFSDEVNNSLFTKRIEQLAGIVKKVSPSLT